MELPRPTHDSFQLQITAPGHNIPLVAGGAKKLSQTSRQDATAKEVVQLVGHEAGQGPAIGLVGPLLLEGQQVLLDYLEKRCFLGFPPRVRVPGRGLCACGCLHDGGLSASDCPCCFGYRRFAPGAAGPRCPPRPLFGWRRSSRRAGFRPRRARSPYVVKADEIRYLDIAGAALDQIANSHFSKIVYSCTSREARRVAQLLLPRSGLSGCDPVLVPDAVSRVGRWRGPGFE